IANRLSYETCQQFKEILMKFMMLMIPAVYQDGRDPGPNFTPDPEMIEQMTRFNEEMGEALEILDLNGLHPPSSGARVAFGKGKPIVTDGPYIESREVLGGYWLLEADSRDEVVEWAQKCPAEDGDVIEIRQIFAAEDFETA
ncbi:MAG: YciI family protein, partial [Gammaproteobacteria bacterium]